MSSTIYLAGGCFWGIQKLMNQLPGVIETLCGYANGDNEADANYETVCRGRTNFRETVRVTYDPDVIGLETILAAYFYVIDPTQGNRQGVDIGSQYQTGVYYDDEESGEIVKRIALLEARAIPASCGYFMVEIEPLQSFYPAEDYHQNFIDKNPGAYCNVRRTVINAFPKLSFDNLVYDRPATELINGLFREAGIHLI